jgi:hypothetical protein
MTELLKAAFEMAAQLPDSDQDRFAALLLEQLRDEARWQKAFAESQGLLAKMADEALREAALLTH